MPTEIKVPRLGWSMEEGTFVEWLKRDGEAVKAGDVLFALEGDKAVQEIESIDSGVLRLIPDGPQNGDLVKVGAVLAFLVEPGEPTPSTNIAAQLAGPAPAAPSRRINERSRLRASQASPASSDKPRISPRAARVAGELKVDWTTIRGTGRHGRIRERDVRAAAAPASASQGKTKGAPGLSFRQAIAARMTQGAHAAAPVTLTVEVDATNLVGLRNQFKAAAGGQRVPGYTDILVKLAARALQEHPSMTQQWIDGAVVPADGIHIAVAVDTPAGLVAPVIRDVPSLGIRDVATQVADLASRALANRLRPQELSGGAFTVSNLGPFGVDAFTPIINVPQCAILGVGRIARRPAVVGETIVARESVNLCLTFDHRIVDGAPAARFLATLKNAVENPGPWLVF